MTDQTKWLGWSPPKYSARLAHGSNRARIVVSVVAKKHKFVSMTSRVIPAAHTLRVLKRQWLLVRLTRRKGRKMKRGDSSTPSLATLNRVGPSVLSTQPALEPPSAAKPTRKKLTIVEDVGEEYLRRLNALFHACDGNDDGVLSTDELRVLVQMIGMSEMDASAAAQKFSKFSPDHDNNGSTSEAQFDAASLPLYLANVLLATGIGSSVANSDDSSTQQHFTIGATFDSFICNCRDLIVQCFIAGSPLPPRAFVMRCQPLKRGFQNCNTDGSLAMTRTELEIALQKLDLIFCDDELNHVMAILDQNHDGVIEWYEFLLAAWRSSQPGSEGGEFSATLRQYFNVEIFSEVPSFIKVAPGPEGSIRGQRLPRLTSTSSRSFSRRNSRLRESLGYLSRIEYIGIRMLTKASEQRLASTKRGLTESVRTSVEQSHSTKEGPQLARRLSRRTSVGSSSRRKTDNSLPETSRQAIFRLETLTTIIGALTGILFGLLAIGLESAIIPSSLDTNSVYYYVYTALLNIAVSFVEVHVLYLTTLISAFRLTVSANLTLYPLDREREFLTRAIARAALQAGNRKDSLFGIDPLRGSPRLVTVLTLLLYKSKRFAVKFLLKLLIKRVLWRAAARTALSLLVLPINALSNGWTLHRVMQHCRVNIIGPGCLISVLEVFMLEDDCFSPEQRVDYMRVIGCAVVSKRAIHPNAEIMVGSLRHKWLRSDMWPFKSGTNGPTSECSCLENAELACKVHPLDDTDLILSTLERYGSILDIVNPTGQVTAISTKRGVSVRRASGLFPTRDSNESRQRSGISMRRHVRNVFFLLVVALICDGSLGWTERKLYVRCCHAAGVLNRWSRVLQIKKSFVAGKGIDVDAVFSLVEGRDTARAAQRARLAVRGFDCEPKNEDEEDSARVPLSEALQYIWNRLAGLLSC